TSPADSRELPASIASRHRSRIPHFSADSRTDFERRNMERAAFPRPARHGVTMTQPDRILSEACRHCDGCGWIPKANPSWLRWKRQGAGIGLRAFARADKL